MNEPRNPTFRPPCVQPDKVRLIGDLKHADVNQCSVAGSPIAPPSWGVAAECGLRAIPSRRDWHFGKVDHKSAYKNLPLLTSDQKFARVLVRGPNSRKIFAFFPTTQLFGSTASDRLALQRVVAPDRDDFYPVIWPSYDRVLRRFRVFHPARTL